MCGHGPRATSGEVGGGALLSLALTGYAVVVEGYHPFAEDGGLYLEGVRYLLDPTLYGRSRGFVTAHLHYSVFAPVLAGVVRGTGLSLEAVVLLAHLLCVWATIFATFLLACELFSRRAERFGAALLMAAGLGLPVAGTSLTIADPYLTARSVSTPCVLLALAAAVRWWSDTRAGRPGARAAMVSGGALLVGGVMHPLMAGYGAVCVGTYLLLEVRWRVPWWARWLVGVGTAVGVCTLMARFGATESAAGRVVSLTRTYWFAGEWAWFELAGLVAPLLLLGALAMWGRGEVLRSVARACVAAGAGAVVISLLFAHPESRSLLVSRLQPLRLFQTVYMVMTVLLGGLLGGLLGQRPWRWATAAAVLGVGMAVPAHEAFAASARLELPWPGDRWVRENAWSAAFLWAREHTPKDALFAVDADYISRPGEDAQSFRALAERSVLPDAAKDGGEAAITPVLAGAWEAGVAAQRGLSGMTAAARRERLVGMGVSWMVVESGARVDGGCPFDDGVVKVCPVW